MCRPVSITLLAAASNVVPRSLIQRTPNVDALYYKFLTSTNGRFIENTVDLWRGGGRCSVGQNCGWVGHNAFVPTNWPVCSLILRKISKIGSARCQILNAPNSFSLWFQLHPAEGAYSAPQSPRPIVVCKGPTSNQGEGTERQGWEDGGTRSKGKGMKGERT